METDWGQGDIEHLERAVSIMKEKGKTVDETIAFLCRRPYTAPLMHKPEIEVRVKILERLI